MVFTDPPYRQEGHIEAAESEAKQQKGILRNSTKEGTIPDFNVQLIFGYAPRDGFVKNSSGTYVPAITFPTASEIYGS